MSISTELQNLMEQLRQVQAAIDVREHIRSIYGSVSNLYEKVGQYKSEGNFDQIPIETKQALNRIYGMLMQLKSDMEADAAFADLIE